jgi:hypothetical protein
MKSKVEELTTGIADTRTGVTDVKTFIDGMRSSRDTKMADMHALKAQLKEQNQRLLAVTQVGGRESRLVHTLLRTRRGWRRRTR